MNRNLMFLSLCPAYGRVTHEGMTRSGFSREGVELGDVGFDLAYDGTDETGFISNYQ